MKFTTSGVLASLLLLLLFTSRHAAATPAIHTSPGITSINRYAAPSDSTYLVQQGDTYYSLARRFRVPLDSLQRWNGAQLQIGQTLYLAHAAPAMAAVKPVAAHSAPAPAPANQAAPARSAAAAAKADPSSGKYGNSAAGSTSAAVAAALTTAAHKTKQRILVIPFDPYLYFSDADDEIARQSKIPRQNVRYVFRNRLNALLAPDGYETIHLLGGVYRDSVDELSKVYKSLNYGYQDNKQSKYNHQPVVKEEEKGGALAWMKRQKEKLGLEKEPEQVPVAKDPNKHFGVTVKDPDFFTYFNNQYGIDYYVFINQFEVKTVYEHCLDRPAMNYERDFLVHYSIYDSNGELVSGNKVSVPYHSNMNDVERIVRDNMPTVARRVLADLPAANNQAL